MGSSPADSCAACGGHTVVRPVPSGCRGLLSGDPAMVAVCESCLSVTPAPGQSATRDWVPTSVSEGLPSDPAAAVGVALLVTFLTSLALHRSSIETVVDYLEDEAGVDPLLVIQRLAGSDAVSPVADLDRREHQLAQLLGDDR